MPYEPQNKLESSLLRAAGDPSHLPQFLRDFLDARIFAVDCNEPPAGDKRVMLDASTTLRLKAWQ